MNKWKQTGNIKCARVLEQQLTVESDIKKEEPLATEKL